MTHVPRSVYEYGDPVAEQIARDERRDHLWAQARGERLAALTRQILTALDGHGLLVDGDRATPIVFSVLADALEGNRAIDLPRGGLTKAGGDV
jgi:hypothetical protein